MAFQVADRVKETTTTTGTGTLNLGGAVSQFQTFVAGIGNGNETYYSIEDPTGTDWEVGIGTVTDAATDTLSRDTVISSSNGGSLVNFGAGEKVVFSTQPASKTFILSSDNTAVISNINASTLTAGTVNDARLSANVTLNNASTISTGTLSQDRLANSSITINGTGVDLGGSINVGDITGVTAGDGLTGGGTTGAVTLNVGAGTGIDVTADTVAVDVSDFMTNGSNNRVLTATGTDAMNAEANMTFDGSTLAVTGGATFTANVALGDLDHILMGATGEYQIYHDHANGVSVIKDVDSGGSINIDADTISLTGGNVGIGTSSPASLLELEGTSTTAKIHIESTSPGTSSFDGSGAGLLLTALGMSTTNKFTPAIQFGSTDPQLTTTNPKVGAAINGIATENYGADTDGGMALAFYTTPDDPGTGQTTTERMRIDSSGDVLIGATTTASSDYGAKFLVDGTSEILAIHRQASDGDFIQFARGGSDSGNIKHSGSNLVINAVNDFEIQTNNGTDVVHVGSNGLVGIGTTSPQRLLHVQAASADAFARLQTLGTGVGDHAVLEILTTNTSASSYIYFGDSADTNAGMIRYGHANDFMAFTVNTSEAMRIDSNGQISISGSTTSFDTTGALSGVQLYYETDSGLATIGSYSSGGTTSIAFHTNESGSASTEKMRLTSTGLGIGTTTPTTELEVNGTITAGTLVETSSIDYKENVQPLEFNDAIYNVNAVKYDRKDGSSKDEVGVIAEELYKVLPDLVTTKDGKPEAVKYTKMTMYLLEALKKQNQEIQELKRRLN